MYNKDILNETINRAVRQAIVECKQKANEDEKLNMIVENVISEHVQILTEKKKSDKTDNNKRKSVLQWLKSPEVNTAEVRRMLEGEPESQEEEDSKRSYFMKKVHGEYGKNFTDEEINRLHSIQTGFGY